MIKLMYPTNRQRANPGSNFQHDFMNKIATLETNSITINNWTFEKLTYFGGTSHCRRFQNVGFKLRTGETVKPSNFSFQKMNHAAQIVLLPNCVADWHQPKTSSIRYSTNKTSNPETRY
jgi:hypothetical protein